MSTALQSEASPADPASPPAADAVRPPRVAWALLLVPALLLAWSARVIWLTYTPTPFNDQWVNVYWWRDAPATGWLKYLFSQHNEHRILFPRLVYLADWKWFQGRNALNLVAIGLIQLAGAAFFVTTARPRRLGGLGLLALATALSLIFSLMQWENLFWGFQVSFVSVYAAAAWAIYLFSMATGEADRTRWGLLAGALALLTVATFSMANGVFAGAAMAAVGLVTRRRPAAITVVGVATVLLLAIYMHGYQQVAAHSPWPLALHHPGRFATYICAYLGNIWFPGDTRHAALAGLAGGAATVAMLPVMLRRAGGDTARAALFGLALFVGMSAATTSLGRLTLGLDQALASRYMTPTAYFWGAQAVFWALTLQRDRAPWLDLERSTTVWTLRLRRSPTAYASAAVAALLVYMLWRLVGLQPIGEAQVLSPGERILAAESALLGGIDDAEALGGVYPDPGFVEAIAPFMRRTHVAMFADPPVATVGAAFTRPIAPAGACMGSVDGLGLKDQGQTWREVGWGWDMKAHRPLSRVVMVDDTGKVLGVGVGGVPRKDVEKARREVRSPVSGWVAVLNRGGGQVIAYGITAAGAACEIGRKPWPQS